MPDTTPLAPMTPHEAISAFNYLRAVHADDVDAAFEFADAEPRMPELLVDVAEPIVVPVTAQPGSEAGEPCADTFALEARGRVFATSLRIWAQAPPHRTVRRGARHRCRRTAQAPHGPRAPTSHTPLTAT